MTNNNFEINNAFGLSELLRSLEPKIFRTISFTVRNEHDAKDLTQEALIRIYQNIHKFDHTACKVETWVYRIVKNLCIDFFRRKKPVDVLGDSDIFISSKENIEKNYVMNEFNTNLSQEIEKLPSHYKKAFVMRHVEDKSLNEISDLLGLPVNTIKSHIHRAKLSLQNALTDYAVAS